jgi:hypothetical protein
MYAYKVDCWVRPRSGFDLAKKTQSFQTMKKEASKIHSSFKIIMGKMIEAFEDMGDGCVIKSFMIETDSIINDAGKEILHEIKKEYPEAKLISCSLYTTRVEKGMFYAK